MINAHKLKPDEYSGTRSIEDELINLIQTYTIEETEKCLRSGKAIDHSEMAKTVTNRIGEELMEKHNFTMSEMKNIVEKAAPEVWGGDK